MFENIIKKAVEEEYSDLHLSENEYPIGRKNGDLFRISKDRIDPKEIEDIITNLLKKDQIIKFQKTGEFDFGKTLFKNVRIRGNIYKTKEGNSIAIRFIRNIIPSLEKIGLLENIKDLINKNKGIILITGQCGMGKSTTLASIINEINENKSKHIITIEDPIEYMFENKRSIIRQREVGIHTENFSRGLRGALRQDPDIIVIGEMRDEETIQTALTAAETGHLIISTLHTMGAIKTIDRIVDIFPEEKQKQIRVQLSTSLEGIISQKLLKKQDDTGRILITEILRGIVSIKNLIREGKTHQVESIMQMGRQYGMKTMDESLVEKYTEGLISVETLKENITNDNSIKNIVE